MQITIITVGKLKEAYWRDAVSEYMKRMGGYAKTTIVEVAEEKSPDKPSNKDIDLVLEKEGSRILEKIGEKDYVVALAIEGKVLTSTAFADYLENVMVQGVGRGHMVFVIGGSFGLSKQVLGRAQQLLSLSALTFPHQLARVLLLEQIYRAYKIIKKEPYHK